MQTTPTVVTQLSPGMELVIGPTSGVMTFSKLNCIFPGKVVKSGLLKLILFTGVQSPTHSLAYTHAVIQAGTFADLVPCEGKYLFSGISHAVQYFKDHRDYTEKIGQNGQHVYVPFSVAWTSVELAQAQSPLPQACVLHVCKHRRGTGAEFLPYDSVLNSAHDNIIILRSKIS